MKHTRKIELAGWQWDVVGRHAVDFIRGCIHSDGCRVINKVTVRGKRTAAGSGETAPHVGVEEDR